MSELDSKIAETLAREDKALFDEQMSEMGVFDMLGETFKGKRKLLNGFGFVLAFLCFGLSVYFGYHFFNSTELMIKLNWMAAFVVSVVSLAAVKIWFWMEMNRVALLRDLKRVELHLALLAEKA